MPEEKKPMVFHLSVEGTDLEFVIFPARTVKVTIEEEDALWDAEQIQEMKQILGDYYGVSHKNVLTDEDKEREWDQLQQFIKEYFNEIDGNETI